MQKLLLGLLTGIVLAIITLVALFLVLRSPDGSPPITSFRPTATPTGAAGTQGNFAASVPAESRIRLTTALADNGSQANATNPTDLTSIEITIGRAEAILAAPLETTSPAPTNGSFPRTETLELTQPVIELFSLRGSGSLAEIGTTQLASGTYQAIRLVITSAKGRQPNGRIVDITLPNDAVLSTTRPLVWQGIPTDIQLVFDLDTYASLRQTGKEYFLTPVVRRLLENDQPIDVSEAT